MTRSRQLDIHLGAGGYVVPVHSTIKQRGHLSSSARIILNSSMLWFKQPKGFAMSCNKQIVSSMKFFFYIVATRENIESIDIPLLKPFWLDIKNVVHS